MTEPAGGAPPLRRLEELERLVQDRPGLFIRYSKGPQEDRERGSSTDYESGLTLPGLSVNPLDPEDWWTRPVRDWLARRLCQYAHIRDGADDERVAWVLAGSLVGRGPDNEPLVALQEVVAVLDQGMIEEARAVYAERFDVGRQSFGG